MDNATKNRWYYLYLAGILIFFFICRFLETPPDARLVAEYERVQPLSGATLKNHDFKSRDFQKQITYEFSTDLSVQEIFDYYDKQLKNNGWNFVGIMSGTQYDGITKCKFALYTKGVLYAHVIYNENELNNRPFTFGLSFGLVRGAH